MELFFVNTRETSEIMKSNAKISVFWGIDTRDTDDAEDGKEDP